MNGFAAVAIDCAAASLKVVSGKLPVPVPPAKTG